MNEALGDIYEEISTQLSSARGLALRGCPVTAVQEYNSANRQFVHYRESLRGYPGYEALEDALTVTYRAVTATANR